MPDLDAYFARIGYTGPRTSVLDTLREIQRRHVFTIPFENLDIPLGRGIHLDPASVERKLVHDRRGGYCFEQNLLLQHVLTALGFKVTPLIARVRWQATSEAATAQTHMILMVEAEGTRYLVDGGFGGASLTTPLRLDLIGTPQPTTHEPRRILQHNGMHGMYMEQTRLPSGEWADLCEFVLTPAPPVDFAVGNWWTSTFPGSRFTQNLIASLAGEGLRHSLLNREFTTRYTDGRSESRTLATPDELLAVLAHPFGLHFPAGTRFNAPALTWSSP